MTCFFFFFLDGNVGVGVVSVFFRAINCIFLNERKEKNTRKNICKQVRGKSLKKKLKNKMISMPKNNGKKMNLNFYETIKLPNELLLSVILMYLLWRLLFVFVIAVTIEICFDCTLIHAYSRINNVTLSRLYMLLVCSEFFQQQTISTELVIEWLKCKLAFEFQIFPSSN